MRKIIITKEQLTEAVYNDIKYDNDNSNPNDSYVKNKSSLNPNLETKISPTGNTIGKITKITVDTADDLKNPDINKPNTEVTVKKENLEEMKIFTKKELNEKRVKKLSENCIFLTKDELFDLI